MVPSKCLVPRYYPHATYHIVNALWYYIHACHLKLWKWLCLFQVCINSQMMAIVSLSDDPCTGIVSDSCGASSPRNGRRHGNGSCVTNTAERSGWTICGGHKSKSWSKYRTKSAACAEWWHRETVKLFRSPWLSWHLYPPQSESPWVLFYW